ncbi:hypothetical protein PG985_016335 [Apiospora marii]|uniref:uncharacterized protein n=1 Tax=Apiospora marii TaxID=335849 RepID=UPI0031324530
MPSAMEPPSSVPATYSAMARKQLVHTDAPTLTSSSHGNGNKDIASTSSQRDHHPPQQKPQGGRGHGRGGRGRGRGRGRGSHTSTYYQTPRPSQQPHHGRKKGQHNKHEEATQQEEDDVYVLTLLTDPAHEQAMSALRRQWFPARRLKVDAHMTLFHALPGRLLETIKRDLGATAARTEKFPVEVDLREDAFRMGRKGVAVQVRGPCEGIVGNMRRGLIDRWEQMGETASAINGSENMVASEEEKTHGVLSVQDVRRGWKAHYTIMNKEDDPARVEECFNELRGGVNDHLGPGQAKGTVLGLRLWRYDRGWWRQEEDFLFSGGSS